MTPTDLIAANVRARMAYARVPRSHLIEVLGWSRRTVQNKLLGVHPIRPEELAALASILGTTPEAFQREPDGLARQVAC